MLAERLYLKPDEDSSPYEREKSKPVDSIEPKLVKGALESIAVELILFVSSPTRPLVSFLKTSIVAVSLLSRNPISKATFIAVIVSQVKFGLPFEIRVAPGVAKP